VADDVTVLRRGRVAMSSPAIQVTPESLTAAMIGGELGTPANEVPPRTPTASVPVFRAEGLTIVGEDGVPRLRDTCFTVHGGEIVGVVGVEGAGQRELLRVLAGRIAPDRGTLERPGQVGFVPEDRHHDAVLLDRSLAENVALRGAGKRTGAMDWAGARSTTEQLMRAFDVRALGARAAMRSLSGGNQQKLVLARELDARSDLTRAALGEQGSDAPRAIVVENPTRGLDVRATAEVHARLRAARDRGAAVVVYSSDLDEVLALSSRVLVAFNGTLRETALDRDEVGRAMLGLA
jgi:simple sugar transport system ATP-binding protein